MLKFLLILLVVTFFVIVLCVALVVSGKMSGDTAERVRKVVMKTFLVFFCVGLIVWAVKLAMGIPDQLVDMIKTAGGLE